MRAIAEEINNLISASSSQDALEERIEAAFRVLRQEYTQRSWPTVAHFVKAMKAVQSRAAMDGQKSEFTLDPVEIAANRMNAGEAVGDDWLYGRRAVELMKSGLVSQETISRYRSTLFFHAQKVGGKDYADKLEAIWRERHAQAEALADAGSGA